MQFTKICTKFKRHSGILTEYLADFHDFFDDKIQIFKTDRMGKRERKIKERDREKGKRETQRER